MIVARYASRCLLLEREEVPIVMLVLAIGLRCIYSTSLYAL